MRNDFLLTPIEYLKGVGPQRGELLRKELGIFTFQHLLTFYPYRYVDRTKFHKVAEINEELTFVQLRGYITKTELIGDKRKKRLVAHFRDSSGTIELVWFQGIKWLEGKFRGDIEYVVFGRPHEFKGRYSMPHPDVDPVNEESIKLQSSLQAMYNSTESMKLRGLDSKGIFKLQENLHAQLNNTIPETLSNELISAHNLINREEALRQIHFPTSPRMLKEAETRLKFDELFFIQLRLLKQKSYHKEVTHSFVFSKVGDYFNKFYKEHLPFDLTNAQKRVVKEIRTDVSTGKQMNRLVQGDVGSGKTIVALMSMLLAIDNGFQACLMAPTEILAAQHYEGLSKLVEPLGINISLLTGSVKGKARKKILQELEEGEMQIVIGTHALIEDTVKFKNIGFVVIDEQHRFGVEQRSKLHKKNHIPPHVLIMTATPIPRTLAMTLYGDLDVSVIDELPPGRKPIKTIHMTDEKRLRMFGFMREQIGLGRQVYVVYPLIKESEKLDLKNLEEGFESLEREFPLPDYRISIVHGKQTSERKDFEMQRFIKGETQIMVATTVIEVGVNVPNASVMVIENSERFGLSQLHQLRGRVGRGADQSFCILMSSHKLSRESRIRMETMVRTNDGFEISEVDMKLRGPGDIEGTQQSGILDLKIADLVKDQQLLMIARNAAQQIIEEDVNLELPKNSPMKNYLIQRSVSKTDWSKVA
ncbi:MAG TPA: ATP-dependent DNA helicase RecG [Bacteroidia bacterium]